MEGAAEHEGLQATNQRSGTKKLYRQVKRVSRSLPSQSVLFGLLSDFPLISEYVFNGQPLDVLRVIRADQLGIDETSLFIRQPNRHHRGIVHT